MPIPDAVDWLKESQVRPGVWARFYEIGTNRPIYVNVNREIVYEPTNLREGYGWQGGYGQSAIEAYEKLMRMGRIAYMKDREFRTPEEERRRLETLERRSMDLIARQTPEGYWVRDDRIACGVFVAASNTLCEYLELWKKTHAPQHQPAAG